LSEKADTCLLCMSCMQYKDTHCFAETACKRKSQFALPKLHKNPPKMQKSVWFAWCGV